MIFPEELMGEFYPLAKSKSNKRVFRSPLDCYREMYDHQPIIFLDEIQIIKGWEKFVRRLADTGYRVYVTGSNAQMLSSEIATTLGGRFLIETVYPYSFREFLMAQCIEIQKTSEYGNARIQLKKQFATYFYYGGLPELLRFDDKRQWLNSLYLDKNELTF